MEAVTSSTPSDSVFTPILPPPLSTNFFRRSLIKCDFYYINFFMFLRKSDIIFQLDILATAAVNFSAPIKGLITLFNEYNFLPIF